MSIVPAVFFHMKPVFGPEAAGCKVNSFLAVANYMALDIRRHLVSNATELGLTCAY